VQAALLSAEVGFESLWFARIDYGDRAARLERKAMQYMWRASASLPEAQVLTGAFITGYGPPDSFCYDIFCADSPVQDDMSLEVGGACCILRHVPRDPTSTWAFSAVTVVVVVVAAVVVVLCAVVVVVVVVVVLCHRQRFQVRCALLQDYNVPYLVDLFVNRCRECSPFPFSAPCHRNTLWPAHRCDRACVMQDPGGCQGVCDAQRYVPHGRKCVPPLCLVRRGW
jgi:hypothetical protein